MENVKLSQFVKCLYLYPISSNVKYYIMGMRSKTLFYKVAEFHWKS